MSAPSVLAAIGLGSNLGDRARHLDVAVREIGRIPDVRVVQVSKWIETDPVGGPPNQGRYLNGAVLVETSLSAHELLAALQSIEREHGRDRSGSVRNGPRTLDLDLLTHGFERHDEPGLCVPHPRMAERDFVLGPLVEIAPELGVPTATLRIPTATPRAFEAALPPASRTVRELWNELAENSPRSEARPNGAPPALGSGTHGSGAFESSALDSTGVGSIRAEGATRG